MKKERIREKSTFQLRVLLAVLLFATAIVFDRTGMEMAGITGEKILHMISADYEDSLKEWVETIAR